MPSPIFQIQKDDKRMCVYSQRDLDYMTKIQGWKPVVQESSPSEPDDLPVIPPSPHVEQKRRGRKPKVSH